MNVEELLTCLETTRSDIGKKETELLATMQSDVFSLVLPDPQLYIAPTTEALASLVLISSSKLADILLPSWGHGHPAALDVYIICPIHQQTFAEVASNPGHAPDVGIYQKTVKSPF